MRAGLSDTIPDINNQIFTDLIGQITGLPPPCNLPAKNPCFQDRTGGGRVAFPSVVQYISLVPLLRISAYRILSYYY